MFPKQSVYKFREIYKIVSPLFYKIVLYKYLRNGFEATLQNYKKGDILFQLILQKGDLPKFYFPYWNIFNYKDLIMRWSCAQRLVPCDDCIVAFDLLWLTCLEVTTQTHGWVNTNKIDSSILSWQMRGKLDKYFYPIFFN